MKRTSDFLDKKEAETPILPQIQIKAGHKKEAEGG